MVSPNGKSDVQLIGSSGSQEVDNLTLETLRRWKFKPATIDGAPVEGSKKVQVEFKVEEE
jgi:protein TonB